MKKVTRSLTTLFTLLFIIACSDVVSANSPEGTVKNMFTALETANVELYLSTVDTEGMEAAEIALVSAKLEEFLDEVAAEFKAEGGIKKLTIDEVTYNKDKSRATVTVTLVSGKGESNTDDVPLIKRDDGWKVSSF